jgi:WD40 repeat protein
VDDIEPSAIGSNDHLEIDTTESIDSIYAIDAIGFRAGQALRRTAPSDGLARIERAGTRRHLATAAMAVVTGMAVVGIAVVAIGASRSAVAPIGPIIDPPVTQLDSPTPTPPTESTAAAPPTTPTTSSEPPIEATAPIVTTDATTITAAISGAVIAQLPTSSTGAALSDDGTILALLAEDAALQTFDVATLAPLATLPCPQPGEPLDVRWDQQHRAMLTRATAMVDSNPGAVAASSDALVRPGCHLAFSADGTRVAVSDASDDVTVLFDAQNGAEIARINGNRPAFSPSDFSIRSLLVVGGAGAATVWDGTTGRQLGTLDSDGDSEANVAATFSPEGTMIATLNVAAPSIESPSDGTLVFWDAFSLERLRSFGGIRSYSFRGKTFVLASMRGTCFCVELVGYQSGQDVTEYNFFDVEVPVGVAFDPLRRFVYFVGLESNQLLDLTSSPQVVFSTRRDFGPRGVWMAAFSPDGTRLVLSGPAGTIVIDSSNP